MFKMRRRKDQGELYDLLELYFPFSDESMLNH